MKLTPGQDGIVLNILMPLPLFQTHRIKKKRLKLHIVFENKINICVDQRESAGILLGYGSRNKQSEVHYL